MLEHDMVGAHTPCSFCNFSSYPNTCLRLSLSYVLVLLFFFFLFIFSVCFGNSAMSGRESSVSSAPVSHEILEGSLAGLCIHHPPVTLPRLPHPWGVWINCSSAHKTNDKNDAHSLPIPCKPLAFPAEKDKECHRHAEVKTS